MGTLVKNVVINWSKSYETISFMRFLVMKLNSYDDTFDDGDNDYSDEIDTASVVFADVVGDGACDYNSDNDNHHHCHHHHWHGASVVFADGQALWNVTDGVTG